jgi:hypothetical protein
MKIIEIIENIKNGENEKIEIYEKFYSRFSSN